MAERKVRLALGFPESKDTAFTRTSIIDIPAVYGTGQSSYRGDSGLPHLPVCPNKYIHIVQGNLSVSISLTTCKRLPHAFRMSGGGSRGGMAKATICL